MPKLDMNYLEELEEYLSSEAMADDFAIADEQKRGEMLDFLEKLMILGELADAQATKLIFKDSYLGMITGVKTQK